MADYNSIYTGAQIDEGIGTARAARSVSGILKSDGSGGVSAAMAGTDYALPVASTTVSAAGVISYKDANGNMLFTVQLPLYNGGVS